MSFQQPEDWNQRATVRKKSGHQIRLSFGPKGHSLQVSCICMKRASKFTGDLDHGFAPIAEIDFTQDPWVPYTSFHKLIEVSAEEYRPIPRGTADQLF
jgi:hypothetical protein